MGMPTDPKHPDFPLVPAEEPIEPGFDDDEEDNKDDIKTDIEPKRVVLIFQAADDGTLEDIVQNVMGHAESAGLFAENMFIGDIFEEEVAPGSRLHQVLTGREPS